MDPPKKPDAESRNMDEHAEFQLLHLPFTSVYIRLLTIPSGRQDAPHPSHEGRRAAHRGLDAPRHAQLRRAELQPGALGAHREPLVGGAGAAERLLPTLHHCERPGRPPKLRATHGGVPLPAALSAPTALLCGPRGARSGIRRGNNGTQLVFGLATSDMLIEHDRKPPYGGVNRRPKPWVQGSIWHRQCRPPPTSCSSMRCSVPGAILALEKLLNMRFLMAFNVLFDVLRDEYPGFQRMRLSGHS